MAKKYYTVEFNITMGAWGEDEGEAYETACARVKGADNIVDLLWNYDECVTEADGGDWDYDDPDAPPVCDQCGEVGHEEDECPECSDSDAPELEED